VEAGLDEPERVATLLEEMRLDRPVRGTHGGEQVRAVRDRHVDRLGEAG